MGGHRGIVNSTFPCYTSSMSTHIDAPQGAIASQVLLPGDPMRAKFIAETFLEGAVCYNQVRGMLGFTGTYKGKRVSVQGTGMGQPSMSIYAEELFRFYNVQDAVRVGTAGGIKRFDTQQAAARQILPSEGTSSSVSGVGAEVHLRDVILAEGACTDSAMASERFGNKRFAPVADYSLLRAADDAARSMGVAARVGLCASSDRFYDKNENWKLWARYGVLAVEMETAELYTLAAEYGRRALAVLTISDMIPTGEATTAQEREQTFSGMIKIALEALAASDE